MPTTSEPAPARPVRNLRLHALPVRACAAWRASQTKQPLSCLTRLGGRKACVTKQSVQQGRRYQLTLRTDPANGAAQQEVDGIVASFSSFPVNFICLGQSNKGNAPADGSCY